MAGTLGHSEEEIAESLKKMGLDAFVEEILKEYIIVVREVRPDWSYLLEYAWITDWEPENYDDKGIRLICLLHLGELAWLEFDDLTSQEAVDFAEQASDLQQWMQEEPSCEMIFGAIDRADKLRDENLEELPLWQALCCLYTRISGMRMKGNYEHEDDASWDDYYDDDDEEDEEDDGDDYDDDGSIVVERESQYQLTG